MTAPKAPEEKTVEQRSNEQTAEENQVLAYHSLTADETLKNLGSSITGLKDEQIKDAVAKYGKNSLKEEPPTSAAVIFLRQFKEIMVLILFVAVIVSVVLGEYSDAFIIGVIIIANALLGFYQEFKAEKSMDALKSMAVQHAKVLRNNSPIALISAKDLVPGDIIVFEAGDIIPADARLLKSSLLKCQEALLTGESLAVKKDFSAQLTGQPPIGDRINMIYSGTLVTEGSGSAVVTATGMKTEMGLIADMLQSVEEEITPLQKRMQQLGKWLAMLCLGGSAVISVIAYFRIKTGGAISQHAGAGPIKEAFMTGVSLAVAAIPEGLAAIITICLAMGVQRMVKKNAIIRRLPAVETLGNATYICSDKTGTLTRNEMTVTRLWTPTHELNVSGLGYGPDGDFSIKSSDTKKTSNKGQPFDAASDENCSIIFNISTLVNNAELENKDGQIQVIGDPTEGALLSLADKGGINRPSLNETSNKVWEGPFDSDRKRMSALVQSKDLTDLTDYKDSKSSGKSARFMVKGAPDTVLEVCNRVLVNNKAVDLDESLKKKILDANHDMAIEALRVMGYAYNDMHFTDDNDYDLDKLEKNLVFVGLTGMIDPPREEVKPSIVLCAKAGIRPVMITGDHKLTASAIATKLGILKEGDKAVSGSELDKISEAEFKKLVTEISVYARVSPAHKLRIVHTLQDLGHVVAMTGDGVNDVPALKEADIGIAMGITGTDVTKQAADMVLADDNFNTIISAVEEGRVIYDNILKFIRFLLASNFGEVTAMLSAIIIGILYPGFPMPFALVQILWVNLLTDSFPAIALGMDPGVKGIMERKPNKPGKSIFADGLLSEILIRGVQIGILTLGIFTIVLYSEGFWQGDFAKELILLKARSAAFTALVFLQLFYVFRCRTRSGRIFKIGIFKNLWLIGAFVLSAALQAAVLYIPFLQNVFHTTTLESTQFYSYWLLIIPAGLIMLIPFPFFENKKSFSKIMAKSNS